MPVVGKPQPILLYIYSICNGIGSPLLAIQWAVDNYNAYLQEHEPSLEITETYIYEISTLANQVAQALLEMSRYPGSVHYLGDVTDFHIHARSLPLNIPPGFQYRVLSLSGTPCKSISIACTRSPHRKAFGLHAFPSNVFWAAHSGLTCLQQDHREWFWSFAENVIPGSHIDLKELDKHLGYRQLMAVPPGAGAPRSRFIWTSVRCDVPAFQGPPTDNQGRLCLPIGWQYRSPKKGLPCMRAIFPFLFWKFVQDIDNMTRADQEVVTSCQLWHEETQLVRLPSLEIWAAAMGLDTVILNRVKLVLPCKGVVRTWQPEMTVGKCGVWAYCDPCCEILTLLGEGWHLLVASHFVRHSFVQFMDVAKDPLMYQQIVQLHTEVHVCSPSCHLSRKRL